MNNSQSASPSPSVIPVDTAKEALLMCRSCGGAGEYEETNYVTMDMAIDAGDRSMAGEPIRERVRCSECGGAGLIPDERVDALIASVAAASQQEIAILKRELRRESDYAAEQWRRAERAEAALREQEIMAAQASQRSPESPVEAVPQRPHDAKE